MFLCLLSPSALPDVSTSAVILLTRLAVSASSTGGLGLAGGGLVGCENTGTKGLTFIGGLDGVLLAGIFLAGISILPDEPDDCAT